MATVYQDKATGGQAYSAASPAAFSAASSTNTSGPHRSQGQDRWPSSETQHAPALRIPMKFRPVQPGRMFYPLQVDGVGRAARPAAPAAPAALSVRGIDHRYLLAAIGRRPAAAIAYRHGAEWAVAHASPHRLSRPAVPTKVLVVGAFRPDRYRAGVRKTVLQRCGMARRSGGGMYGYTPSTRCPTRSPARSGPPVRREAAS